MSKRSIQVLVLAVCGALSVISVPAQSADAEPWSVVEGYCFKCHNSEDWAGSIAFDLMSADDISHDSEIW